MNKILKSKKGASSILVMLLLVVLVVFGVAALTTALSNVRLGQKTADWNDKYYAADAKANEMYAQLDKSLSDALLKKELSSKDPSTDVTEFMEYPAFEVLTETQNDIIYFSYEAWEADVGISVTLSYDTAEERFKITRYTAMQAE